MWCENFRKDITKLSENSMMFTKFACININIRHDRKN
jgi:hypothetical protein